MVMEMVVSSWGNYGIDIWPDSNLADLEFADDFLPLNEHSGRLQGFFDLLVDSIDIFGMLFAFSKCQMLLEDWI